MNSSYLKCIKTGIQCGQRYIQTSSVTNANYSCKLLVLGGGAGGCSTAAKFTSKLGSNQIIIVDPADRHYYQPMFTMIGGGIKKLKQSSKPMSSVLPKSAQWVKDSVTKIDPVKCKVMTDGGDEISYEYLVIALGLELHYEKVKGLEEALSMSNSGVCSNYSPKYVDRTFNSLKNFKKGNAVFTFPNTPIKCGGAPLKACFISEDYMRNKGNRGDAKFYFKTALPVVFTAKDYANKLLEIFKGRDIDVGLREELVEVKPKEKKAIFKKLESPQGETFDMQYELLHVTPPMTPSSVLKCDPTLHDPSGYLTVNKFTLQHDKYPNIFGLGDCTNIPTSKTAAAVAGQSGVLYDNLSAFMDKKELSGKYDGYTSCPLVTGYSKCIMAEFDYDLKPLETFPFNQNRELRLMYFMKKEMMPQLYWLAMMNGYWRGPKLIRKALHLGMSK